MAAKLSKSSSKELARQNEKNKLQRMYLLNEPAFKKYKEELDSERYLTSLDRELKKILGEKTPSYKKWLKYKDALIRYTDFKRMLTESKANEDVENVRKLSALENNIKKLQSKINQKDFAELSEKTVQSRIESLPPIIRRKLTNDGRVSTHYLTITIPNKNDEEEMGESIVVDVKKTKILKDGTVSIPDPEGNPIHIPNISPNDKIKLRNALMTEHHKIDMAIEEYNQLPINRIKFRHYQIENDGKKKKRIKYKGIYESIPNALLDEVIKLADTNDLSGPEMKRVLNQMKESYVGEKDENRKSQSFLASFTQSNANDSSLLKTMRSFSKPDTPRKTPRSKETGKRLRDSFNQTTIDDYRYKKLKSIPENNMLNTSKLEGRGRKRKWQKI